MASGSTSYPTTPDVFNVPSNPESTPLSSAGDGTRDLTQSIGDQGAAVMALEGLSAVKTHTHAGGSDGTLILAQSSTHANNDADTGTGSIHHSIGPGAFQASAGNHVHNYSSLANAPYIICDSLTHPGSPFAGMMIFETDTNFLRIWADTGSGFAWQLIPFLALPTVELIQTSPQLLHHPGWIQLLWHAIVEDTNHFFNGVISETELVVHDAGLYATRLAVQFDPAIAPNIASVAIFVNGVLSSIQQNVFQRGETFTPGISQTLSATGPLRLGSGDVVTSAVSYVASDTLGAVNTFVDTVHNLTSRIGLNFLGI